MAVGIYAVQLGDTLMLEHDSTKVRLGPVPAVKLKYPLVAQAGRPNPVQIGIQMPTPKGENEPWIWALEALVDDGWSILSAWRALPTEAGAYLDANGEPWKRSEDGDWTCTDGTYIAAENLSGIRAFAPFTRLVPEQPDDAKEIRAEVIEWIAERVHDGPTMRAAREHWLGE